MNSNNNNDLLFSEEGDNNSLFDSYTCDNMSVDNNPLLLNTRAGKVDNNNLLSFERMASTSSDQNTIAQKTWELSNNIETISSVDEIYRYDRKEQQDILTAKPWEKE